MRTPRFQRVAVARIPSGSAKVIESRVPATAVAKVCATARNTVRRKPADRSGGKSPIKKFQSAAAVAGRNRTPGRTSANRQEKARSASAATAYRTRVDVVRE